MSKNVKKNDNICIKLPMEQIMYLKKMSHYLSIERGQDLSLSDLVREAIDGSFPMPIEGVNEKQEDKS